MSSHQQPRDSRALCGLLSLTLPDRIGRILTRTHKRPAGRVTINTLPDDVLLLILHFDQRNYLDKYKNRYSPWLLHWKWYRLVHVCWRWRSVVFASPKYLDLKLVYYPWTPVELTGVWPPLPVIITNSDYPYTGMPEFDFSAVIMPRNRVCEIHWHFSFDRGGPSLQKMVSAMQEQLPSLIHLELDFHAHFHFDPGPDPALPDGFLGGSAPRLQVLDLMSISFPALPKLLLSATDLVRLTLRYIPHSGYFSPDAIVTSLAALANLESLTIGFESPLSLPDRQIRRALPPARATLPALTRLVFKGVSEYLEDLVARIDTPLLDSICITFFYQLIFDIPQLAQFMRRTTRFQALNEAHVQFRFSGVWFGYLLQTSYTRETSGLEISCKQLDWQLSCVPQVFKSFLPSTHMVETLYIYDSPDSSSEFQDDIEDIQWLEMFHPFAAVKNLYVGEVWARRIAPALQELVEGRMPEALPSLQNIFLGRLQPSGRIPEGIEKFVATRQLSDNPITVSRWERDPVWEGHLISVPEDGD